MPTPAQMHTEGSPCFASPELTETQRQQGTPSAWAQALAQGQANGEEALAQVCRQAGGQWSVAMRGDTGQVFMAVDRFATQPLCYTNVNGEVRFAERADALAGPDTPIDPQALFDYLYFHMIPSPRTVFDGVQRLPAAHLAWQDGGALKVRRYWKPGFQEVPQSFDAARETFRTLLAEAVGGLLDGSRPACFLSGGTDSSTVAGLIRQVTGAAPLSYSIGFEAEGYDEMAYARIAARHFGTEHREHYISPADLVRLIPEVAAHHDQPFGNSSALPTYFCAMKAREEGVTRLLAGDGGDELFGGNTRYATQKIFGVYDELPGLLKRGLLGPATDSGALDKLPLLKKGASYVRQARVPMPDRLHTYNLLLRLGQDQVLTPAFLAQVDTQGPQQQQRAVWAQSEGASLVNRMLAYDWHYTLAENDLPKVRGGTQLAGVSVGYPFLDRALLDFSMQLPTDFKLKGLKLRWFFKEALRGFLPDAILSKKKHGFGLPFGVWAVKDPALRALASDSVRGLAERGIVRPTFATALVNDYLPQHPGYYGEMVWILMMLEQWFRHHRPDYRLD